MRFLISCLFVFVALQSHATETQESIEGRWQVVAIDGEATTAQDIWLFSDNTFHQSVANYVLPNESYQQQAENVQLDQANMTIIRSSDDFLTVSIERYTFELKKINPATTNLVSSNL